MKYKVNPRYSAAKYEFSLIDQNGTVLKDPWPFRTDRNLTTEEMKDAAKNGLEKYCIPMFVDENGKEIK